MERKYLAHVSEDKTREQTILEHLSGTANLAGQFAAEFGFEDWGYCEGMLHDIGKYSLKFQDRLQGSEIRVDHATAGAQVCNAQGGCYQILGYCIAGHHAGLPDRKSSMYTTPEASYEGKMKKRLENYQDYRQDVEIPQIKTQLFPMKNQKRMSFSLNFFIRMLYSCLVDADYLDTESFMQDGRTLRQESTKLGVLWERFQCHINKKEWLENTDITSINGRRTEILRHCMEMGAEKKGAFLLTVPTGGGKTVASVAFALRHGVKHEMKRIIYVIPYTSIIEQNAQVFREILGNENVLEHHSSVDYEATEELRPMQLASENWDKPVVVTTSVQFFESLFSNKPSKCRKLHNIANSVIIFDEAQMLPNDYLRPCTAAIEELVEHYGCSVVLCTATQPALGRFFSQDIDFRELCPRVQDQFSFFRRTRIQQLGIISQEELLDRLRKERQALCILNTKREVQQVYEQLKGENVYHLSTLMYPVHRKRVLAEIRERLEVGKSCLVIATSLVEAGVDLDFETVYRQVAGVDSIIQAAGRCNREGNKGLEESCTYVFQLKEARKVPRQEQQMDVAQMIIREHSDIAGLEAIQEYFERLYDFRGNALDKKKIMEQLEEDPLIFATIAKQFRVIEEATKTIFIPKEERAKEILTELGPKGATRQLMREAGQYCVNVYENIFKQIYGAGMLRTISEDLKEDFFVLVREEDYSEEMGLKVDVELGGDIWY